MSQSAPRIDRSAVISPSERINGSLFIGQDLDLDVWVKPELKKSQSLMIRSVDPQGVIRSAFLHIDGGKVRVVPTFTHQDQFSLDVPGSKKAKEINWTPDRVVDKKSILRISIQSLCVAIVGAIATALLLGAIQCRTILTGSMVPYLHPGDVVVAAATKYVSPTQGKVALYHARDLQGTAVSVWAHRIIAGDARTGFIFKGDANSQPDLTSVPLSDVESVVLFKIPAIGRFFHPLSVLLVSSGVIIFSAVVKRFRRRR